MSDITRKATEFIILVNPLIYGLQEAIEKEQEELIADRTMPAEKLVEKLIALDNRRIDLCNLNVLYAFIERGLGESFALLRSCAFAGIGSELYELAARQAEAAGYPPERVIAEFAYLFKLVRRRRRAVGAMSALFSYKSVRA